MKNLLLLFCCLLVSYSYSQKIITGKIVDTYNQVISDASISSGFLRNDKYTTQSDSYGLFHFVVYKHVNTLKIRCSGYKTVTISSLDTIKKPLLIVMEKNTTSPNSKFQKRINPWFIGMGLGCDFLRFKFDEFSYLLGTNNTDMINQSKMRANFLFSLLAVKNRYRLGFDIGFQEKENSDSLKIKASKWLVGLNCGYELLRYQNFILSPEIGLKMYDYQLRNYFKQDQIPINQYLKNKDLNLDFYMYVATLGANLIYRYDNLFEVNLYGAYVIPLNEKPIVRSPSNRLSIDNKVYTNSLNFGFRFSYFFNR